MVTNISKKIVLVQSAPADKVSEVMPVLKSGIARLSIRLRVGPINCDAIKDPLLTRKGEIFREHWVVEVIIRSFPILCSISGPEV